MKLTTIAKVEVSTWWEPRGEHEFKLMATVEGNAIVTGYNVGWLTQEEAQLNVQNGYDTLDEGWHWCDDECWRSHDELVDFSDGLEGVLQQAVRSKLQELTSGINVLNDIARSC